MGGRVDEMFLIVFVFFLMLSMQLVNGQDYTWDGAEAAGVPETFYRFGPRYDKIMESSNEGSTVKMDLDTDFPFFDVDQKKVSVSTQLCFLRPINTLRFLQKRWLNKW